LEAFERVPPSLVGPVELNCEEEVFNANDIEDVIIRKFKRDFLELEKLCVHGYELTVNGKKLRKAKQLLVNGKHASKIVITPVIPVEKVLVEEEDKPEGESDAD
jgi:hypothetical protein